MPTPDRNLPCMLALLLMACSSEHAKQDNGDTPIGGGPTAGNAGPMMQPGTDTGGTPAGGTNPSGMHGGSGGNHGGTNNAAADDAGNESPLDASARHDGGDVIVPQMVDRSALTNVGTDQPLDYADPSLWLCRPGNSRTSASATSTRPSCSRRIAQARAAHVRATRRSIASTCIRP